MPSSNNHTAVSWMRSAIDTLAATHSDSFLVATAAPAGIPIEIRFDDPALAEIYLPRLVGRETTLPPRAVIYAINGNTPALKQLPRFEHAATDPSRFQAELQSSGLRAAYLQRSWRFYDASTNIGVQLAASGSDLPPWDAGAPLRYHLRWIMEDAGLLLTHAAALGAEGRGILLVGQGGAGKSGTTLAGLAAGLSTVGDDYVALRTSGAPVARSLYRYFKQNPDGIDRVPGLRAAMGEAKTNWQGKVEFDPARFYPGCFADELKIEAIVLPSITGAPAPDIRPIRNAEAMLELMRSNLLQYIGEQETRMSPLASVVRDLPCFRIGLSPDALLNGHALRRLIETLPGGSP